MPRSSHTSHSLALRSAILVGLLAFGVFLVSRAGLLSAALEGDRSYISYAILGVYAFAAVHWGFLTLRLSAERNRLESLESLQASASLSDIERTSRGGVRIPFGDGTEEWPAGDLSLHLGLLLQKRETGSLEGEQSALMTAFGDTLANRHSPGHFASDLLLKMGLLGTMVGFILMLGPVAQMSSLEDGQARDLLQTMSGGMAIALYTTIAGLVTSTLLKAQYQLLDSAGQDLINRVTVVTDSLVAEQVRDSGRAEA